VGAQDLPIVLTAGKAGMVYLAGKMRDHCQSALRSRPMHSKKALHKYSAFRFLLHDTVVLISYLTNESVGAVVAVAVASAAAAAAPVTVVCAFCGSLALSLSENCTTKTHLQD